MKLRLGLAGLVSVGLLSGVWAQVASNPAPGVVPVMGTPGMGTPYVARAPRAPAQRETVELPTSWPEGFTESGKMLLTKIDQGGKTTQVQLVLSVFALAFVLERFFSLRRKRIAPKGLAEEVDRLWRGGQYDEIAALCERNNSTFARMIRKIVKYRHLSMAEITAIASDFAARELRRHVQRAYPIAVVATLEPLLGLFGTVLGMIRAFEKVAVTGSLGDASLLADDIALALITTAVGLIIAIPALGFYHYFKNRTTMLGLMLEEEASELMYEWFLMPPAANTGESSPVS